MAVSNIGGDKRGQTHNDQSIQTRGDQIFIEDEINVEF